MQFLTDDHVKLVYTDEGDGQPIIFLTGYSGIKEEWYFQRNFYVNHGYRVITVDWRNHGESARTGKNLTIKQLAADVNALIMHLKLDKVILIGHSMGASVIWAYQSQYGETHIAIIITIDESPKLTNDSDWQSGVRNLNAQTMDFVLPTMMNQQMCMQPIDSKLRQLLAQQHESHFFDATLNAPLLANHALSDWRQTLADLSIPQLIVTGERSPIWQHDFCRYCEKVINDESRVVTINQVGHMPQIEVPEKFNEITLDFIQHKLGI